MHLVVDISEQKQLHNTSTMHICCDLKFDRDRVRATRFSLYHILVHICANELNRKDGAEKETTETDGKHAEASIGVREKTGTGSVVSRRTATEVLWSELVAQPVPCRIRKCVAVLERYKAHRGTK